MSIQLPAYINRFYKYGFFWFFITNTFILFSCTKDETLGPHQTFLHLSHTRTASNPYLDNVVESINYENFDMLLLGGDLSYYTSEDDLTMDRVNQFFNIGSNNTLWSLGNHDYTDLSRVELYTNRPSYYSYFNNGISFLVLDTQDSLSNMVGNQKDMIFNLLDTIQLSTHLIILHHKLIWMYDHPSLESEIPNVSNAGLGNCFNCINPNNFYSEIYPRLVEVNNKGIQVICIGGDIGNKVNEFEYITNDGIYFLASGIDYLKETKKALLFIHDLNNQSLSWNYEKLNDL